MSEPRVIPIFEATEPSGAAVKLLPRDTGLPMAVWLTRNDGRSYNVRVLIGPLPHAIVPGSPTATDLALVVRWIELNRDVIVDFWNWTLGRYRLTTRLQRLP
jgi:hypothetical protein